MGLETLFPTPKTVASWRRVPRIACFRTCCGTWRSSAPNQVWGVDITYIRLVSGWMYLVAFLDWYRRYVVAWEVWEVSDTLEMDFVIACGAHALTVAVAADRQQ